MAFLLLGYRSGPQTAHSNGFTDYVPARKMLPVGRNCLEAFVANTPNRGNHASPNAHVSLARRLVKRMAMCQPIPAKYQHWSGFQAENGWSAAPVKAFLRAAPLNSSAYRNHWQWEGIVVKT